MDLEEIFMEEEEEKREVKQMKSSLEGVAVELVLLVLVVRKWRSGSMKTEMVTGEQWPLGQMGF